MCLSADDNIYNQCDLIYEYEVAKKKKPKSVCVLENNRVLFFRRFKILIGV